MNIIQEPQLSDFSACPYLKDEEVRFEYFFASELDEHELNELLKSGWRKFGLYYFRPACLDCRKCIPLRIVTAEYRPSKSQRRVIKKASAIDVKFTPLHYRDEIYEIYSEHSIHRFGKYTTPDDFIATFYARSCPSIQSEYYYQDELAAVGFIDRSGESLSSVYFVYKTSFQDFRLGTYSVIKEIEYALALGLKYYYLGYYVPGNRSMEYKNRFNPNEKFEWNVNAWIPG